MNDDKILVEIASYCDPELLNTINSALIQADNPERVYFSVCYQSDEINDYNRLLKVPRCKVKWLKENETKGSCYARYLCQQMIEDEKYVFQIDSHMRFIKHWDTKMIEELLSLNDKKAVISFYPPNCEKEALKYPLDDKYFDNPASGGLMYVYDFRQNESEFSISSRCETINSDDPKVHSRSALIGAGNFFSFAQAHKDAIHDPNMYFYGDELFMDISLFTHGYNIYNSGVCYVYHEYNRKNQKFPKVERAMDKERDRLSNLINHRNNKKYLKEYHLGTERTITEFEKFSGIDFKNKTIYMNAETGEFENKNYIGKLSFLKNKDLMHKKLLDKKDIIEVLLIDIFGNYEDTIKSCLKNATYNNRIKFIVGSINNTTPSKEKCLDMHIKKYINFNKDDHYTKILNSLTKYMGNNYITIIDSTYRFLYGWDKYLCDNIKNCGTNCALTSWVWDTEDEEKINNLSPYVNIDMKITDYYLYLPIFSQNFDIDFSKLENPHQAAFMFNGFLFCHSKVLRKIEVDPNINYEDHRYIYSLRLWTNGIDLYIPKTSFFVRNKNERVLNTISSNLKVLCSLFGFKNYYSKTMEANYPYDIGKVRPLWTWYKFINEKYEFLNKENNQ